MENPNPRNSMAGMVIIPIILVTGLVTILGGISFILLSLNRKTGFYLSVGTLFILFFVFGFSVSGYLDTLSDFISLHRDADLRKIIEYLTLGLSGSIFVSLYFAWKKLTWK